MKTSEPAINKILIMINIVSAFIFFITQTQWLWALFAIQCFATAYFVKSDFSSFVHSLFWPLFLASLLTLSWPASFIVSIVVYLTLMFLSKRFKEEVNWLRSGTINKTSLCLMIPVILISSAALILWVFLFKPDLSDLNNMVPKSSIPGIIFTGLVFSVFNSIWEEIILKGILWNALENIISNSLIINIFQAVLFGIMHLNGFPRGITGAVLAGIYGLLIGFIRKQSNGLLAPIVTHFFADATIFGIIIALQL